MLRYLMALLDATRQREGIERPAGFAQLDQERRVPHLPVLRVRARARAQPRHTRGCQLACACDAAAQRQSSAILSMAPPCQWRRGRPQMGPDAPTRALPRHWCTPHHVVRTTNALAITTNALACIHGGERIRGGPGALVDLAC